MFASILGVPLYVTLALSIEDRLFNSLPNSIKEVETVLAFKIGYDEWVSERVLGGGAGRHLTGNS